MPLFRFGGPVTDEASADAAIAQVERQREELLREKEDKLARQVELWSILTPTSDLEAEYRAVSADIAFIIKKVMCLDDHLEKLKVARYHCKSGDCGVLSRLLKGGDPCRNLAPDVPKVDFQKGAVVK